MSTHTPAPWRVCPFGRGYDVATGTNSDPGVIATCTMRSGEEYTEAESNARLIAAAPELLEACESAVAGLDSLAKFIEEQSRTAWGGQYSVPNGGFTLTKKLRAVIAKAKSPFVTVAESAAPRRKSPMRFSAASYSCPQVDNSRRPGIAGRTETPTHTKGARAMPHTPERYSAACLNDLHRIAQENDANDSRFVAAFKEAAAAYMSNEIDRLVSIMDDTRKAVTYDRTSGWFFWSDRDGENQSAFFPSFLDAARDACEPYLED